MELHVATLKSRVHKTNSAELTKKIALMLVYSKEWIVEFTTAQNDGNDIENSLSDWRDALLRDRKNTISIRRIGSNEDINIAIPFFDPHDHEVEIYIQSDNIKSDEFDYAVRTIKGCIAFLLDSKNEKKAAKIIEGAWLEYLHSVDDSLYATIAEFDSLKIQRLNKQHYQILLSALSDVGVMVSDIDDIESKYWEKIQPFPDNFDNLNEIEENLDLALRLGLEPLDAARAYFMLMSIWLTKEKEGELLSGDNDVTDTPDLLLFARNIISLTRKHLVEDSQSSNALFALRLQGSANLFLNEQEGVNETKHTISKLEAGHFVKKRNDGKALEEAVKVLLQSMGLQADTTRTTGDGGIDIVAYSVSPIFSGKYVVQCKDWAGSVGEGVVRDLYGVVMAEAANKGILVTTGTVSKSAQKFADVKPLELIDGEQLSKLLSKFKTS